MTALPSFDLRGSGRAFTLVQDGRLTPRSFTRHDHAQAALERARRTAKVLTRPCLSCASLFPSQGPHNRLCSACREGVAG